MMADDLLLVSPAHAFRFIETAAQTTIEQFPKANAFYMYDHGNGVRTAVLATLFDTVIDNVRADPQFYGRICVGQKVAGGRIGFLAQHYFAVTGIKPTEQAQIDEAEAAIAGAEAALSEHEKAGRAPMPEMQERVSQLRQVLELQRSKLGAHSQLEMKIPDPARPDAPHYYTYFLTDPAADLLEQIEPTPAAPPAPPPKPGVNATPVREPRRRRKAA
jgi:hypothetical protein